MSSRSSQLSNDLYVIGTPIGNADDLSCRAKDILSSVQCIVCEDTRQTKQLLLRQKIFHGQILICGNEYRQEQIVPQICTFLTNGQAVAYVTDAGTPGISDPGAVVIGLVRERGFQIRCIPGPSSITAFLSVIGRYYQSWSFCGFLPRKDGDSQQLYQSWLQSGGVFICLESPKRILKSLALAKEALGPSTMTTVGKELSKSYEKIWQGSIETVEEQIRLDPESCQGEFIVCFEVNKDARAVHWMPIAKKLAEAFGTKQSAKMIADCFEFKASDVYQLLTSDNVE